jgi:hypothetical protein
MSSPKTRRKSLDDPGFTPAVVDLEAVLAELEGAAREDAPRIERVLARAGERALTAVLERLPEASPTLQARLANVLGRLADPRASGALRQALGAADTRVARRAAKALGKLGASGDDERANERALRERWGSADVTLRRSLAEALGKLGGAEARELLRAERADDPELGRLVKKALLLLERRQSRDGASASRTDAPLGRELLVLARCRAGLSELLAGELAALGKARVRSPSVVELPFSGRLAELFVARTALDFGVRVALPELGSASLIDAVARALGQDDARTALGAWTTGTPRYRLTFSEGGHQRALLFRLVEAIAGSVPELVNDSRDASWEIVVVRAEPAYLVLVPLAEDPRFSYRKRDVRAASHPTIAAALARMAGVRPNEVVWDPFLGSGLELIERAKLGPFRTLLGSDLDPAALDAARENLASAGVQAELRVGDAARLMPERVSLVLTNPPMGRRLLRDRTLGSLLDAFVSHVARVLVPGGRLVWLSPLPDRTRRAATAAGLRGTPGPLVDMGGFEAELQTFQSP